MICTVASFKGGVGKTTTAVHLACYLQTKAPTLLIDGDENRSATGWNERGEKQSNPLPFKVVDELQGVRFARSYEHVVIDTQGSDVHARSYRVLKVGGRLIWFNAAPIEDRAAQYGVIVQNVRVEDDHAALDRVCRLMQAGVLKPRVAMELPLAEAARAHRLVESGTVKHGRMILTVT